MSELAPLSFQQRLGLLLRRLAALGYDLLLLLALGLVATIPWVAWTGAAARPGEPGLQVWLALVCGGYVLAAWVRQGATLGMLAWGLRVQALTGGRLSPAAALLRLLLAVAGTLALGITWWWCLIDRSGRCLHDVLTGSRVGR